MAAAALPILIPLALQALPGIVQLIEQLIPQANGIGVKLPVATKMLDALHNALVDANLTTGPAPDLGTVQTAITSTVNALKTTGSLQSKAVSSNAPDIAMGIVYKLVQGAASIMESAGVK